VKVALLQLCATDDKLANIVQAYEMCEEALTHKSQLVLLPEVFNFRGDLRNKECLKAVSENIPGPSTEKFILLAKKHKASILLGSIIEKADSKHAYNTSVFIDPKGSITTKYRKIHLFDATINDKLVREADCFKAGQKPMMVKVGEMKLGLSICYDLRFPQLYQGYTSRGANILTVPSCFTRKTGEAHWQTLLCARAIENLSYVLAPNQVGTDIRGLHAHGHSMIVSPWGEIIAEGSAENKEIVYGNIDLIRVKEARTILPGVIPTIKERKTYA
jgi:nitrilase